MTAEELVSQARSLEGTTMPDGKPYQQASPPTRLRRREREDIGFQRIEGEEANGNLSYQLNRGGTPDLLMKTVWNLEQKERGSACVLGFLTSMI